MLRILVIAVLAVGALANKYEVAIEEELEELCKMNGAEDKIEEVRNATSNLFSCLRNCTNGQSIVAEIEAAPMSTRGKVIKKYCDKTPQMEQCINAFIDGISPCFDEPSRSSIPDAKFLVHQFFLYVCGNHGNWILRFIEERGPECVSNNIDAMKQCLDTARTSVPNADAHVVEQCAKYDRMTSCVVISLKECPSSNVGNMAESLFSYIRKQSPCKDITEVSISSNKP